MLGLSVATRILLFTGATDMRKGFDGLAALVMAAGEELYDDAERAELDATQLAMLIDGIDFPLQGLQPHAATLPRPVAGHRMGGGP